MKISIKGEAKLVEGHVLDVSRPHLLAALRRYDPLLYIKWNAKKRAGLGVWELRRKPEFKTIKEGEKINTPKGWVIRPGDIFEMDNFTITVPKYHENNFENHVKDFEKLGYHMVDWLASHDLWKYGYKGKDVGREADYNEAVYDNKIDEDSYAEKQYMIKQHRTQFQDFAAYINAGGNPARLVDYWDKQ
jgi:hypothetical protein